MYGILVNYDRKKYTVYSEEHGSKNFNIEISDDSSNTHSINDRQLTEAINLFEPEITKMYSQKEYTFNDYNTARLFIKYIKISRIIVG